MQQRSTRADWLVFLGLGLAWGTSYVFIKLGIQTLGTFTLIAGRLGVGFALLATVVAVAREKLPPFGRIYLHLAVMGVLSVVLPFALITTAERTVDSSLAAILNGAVPLFAIVIAALFLHDEPFTVGRLAGLLIGYVGVVVVVWRGSTGGGPAADLTGELLLVASAVCYGVGAVYARRNIRGVRPMIPALFQVGFAFVITAVIAVATERPLEGWVPTAFVAVLWLGLIGSGLAYLANFRLLFRWGAGRTSLVAYLLPIVGIVAGGIVFGETVEPRVLLGTGLVFAGVALVNSRWGQRRIFGRTPPTATP